MTGQDIQHTSLPETIREGPSLGTQTPSSSTTATPSASSYRRDVADNNEDDLKIAGFDKFKDRKYTIDASVKASRWVFFKGVFMPKRMERKVSTTVRLHSEAEPSPQVILESPWVLRVSVLSKMKRDSTRVIPKGAQCTLDTGNQQGNMVSKDFLFNILGYTEADFVELTEQEKYGGTSASGHRVTPEAAVLLTWYYGTSPRTFNDMRFLVTSNPDCDLVIGVHSIVKHKLLSPPNLGVEGGRVLSKFETDENQLDLKIVRQSLIDELDTKRRDLKKVRKEGDQSKIARYEASISVLEKKLKVAEIQQEIYLEEKKPGANPKSEKDRDFFARKEQELEEARSKLPKLNGQSSPSLLDGSKTEASGSK